MEDLLDQEALVSVHVDLAEEQTDLVADLEVERRDLVLAASAERMILAEEEEHKDRTEEDPVEEHHERSLEKVSFVHTALDWVHQAAEEQNVQE